MGIQEVLKRAKRPPLKFLQKRKRFLLGADFVKTSIWDLLAALPSNHPVCTELHEDLEACRGSFKAVPEEKTLEAWAEIINQDRCAWRVAVKELKPTEADWSHVAPSEAEGKIAAIKCDQCEKAFSSKQALRRHMASSHAYHIPARRSVSCSICPACLQDFSTRPRAIYHIAYRSTACATWVEENGPLYDEETAAALDDQDKRDRRELKTRGLRPLEAVIPGPKKGNKGAKVLLALQCQA